MIYPENMAAALTRFSNRLDRRDRREDDAESTGDHPDLDDRDIAAEGANAQRDDLMAEAEEISAMDDANAVFRWRLRMVRRYSRIKARVATLEKAAERANNEAQKLTNRVAELERTVRALTAVQETAA